MLKINIKEKSYEKKLIFDNVNLNLSSGIYILKGENGSGKTTLFNILYKEDLDYNGEIIFDEKNINDYDKTFYRNKICNYFTQDDFFFEDSTIKEILEFFNLEDKAIDLLQSLNLNNKKKRKYKNLSGGEKQKIRLIISLLSEGNIILLDEPENNLDEESVEIIYKYIKEFNKIIIISSHILNDNKYLENYNILKIESNDIRLIKLNNEIVIKETKEENKITKPKKVNKNIIKNLNKISLSLSIVILLFSIFISIIASHLSTVIFSINNTRDILYSETSTIIYPPVYNMLFDQFGEEKWLETHDGYFTTEDYEKLSSLDYVTKIEPVTAWNKLIYFPYTDDNYQLGPILDYSTLNYEKYNMEKYKSSLSNVNVEYYRLMNKYDVLTNVPFYYSGHSDIKEIIYGRYPKDETDEIMIDIYMGMYLAQEMGLDSLEELVGSIVEIPAVQVESYQKIFTDYPEEDIVKKTYTVSGIYVPLPSKTPTNKIYAAYDPNSLTVLENSYGFTNDKIGEVEKEKYTYYTMQSANEWVGKEYMTLEEFQDKYSDNRMFTGFYIEVSDPQYLDDLTSSIENNDKYIEVSNNYTIQNSNNFKYLSRNLVKLIISLFFIQLIFIIIMIFLYRYYEIRNERNIKLLKFYGFDKKNIKKIRILAFFKLMYISIILFIFLAIFLHRYLSLRVMLIEYIIIFLVMFIFYKLKDNK